MKKAKKLLVGVLACTMTLAASGCGVIIVSDETVNKVQDLVVQIGEELQKEEQDNNELIYGLNEDGKSYSVIGASENISATVVIPDQYQSLPITRIRSEAFKNCNIETLTIGGKVRYIDAYAFWGCEKLQNVKTEDMTYWGVYSSSTMTAENFIGYRYIDSESLNNGATLVEDSELGRCWARQ